MFPGSGKQIAVTHTATRLDQRRAFKVCHVDQQGRRQVDKSPALVRSEIKHFCDREAGLADPDTEPVSAPSLASKRVLAQASPRAGMSMVSLPVPRACVSFKPAPQRVAGSDCANGGKCAAIVFKYHAGHDNHGCRMQTGLFSHFNIFSRNGLA